MIQLPLPLNMTTTHVVETSVIVNNNSPIQDFVHLDDQTQPTFEMTPAQLCINYHVCGSRTTIFNSLSFILILYGKTCTWYTKQTLFNVVQNIRKQF